MRAYDPSRTALFHPERQATVFDAAVPPSTLGLAAEAARLAYLRHESDAAALPRLQAAMALAGFAHLQPFADAGSGTQAFAAWRPADGLALIAVRGTQPDELQDLLANAGLLPQPFQGGLVHGGFLRAMLPLRQRLADWLQKQAAARSRLLLCGHSLGGALATLLMPVLAADQLVTFGSPRVGDQAFADAMAGRDITRVVNCCDVVTKLPPRGLPYVHVGQLLYIAHDGRLEPLASVSGMVIDEAVGRAELLLQHGLTAGILLSRDLTDHAPFNYVRAFVD